jgi:hypothetical protein
MSVNKTPRHKSFAASEENTPEEELVPVTFDVAGETFTAKADIQGIVLMDFLEASDSGGVTSLVAFKKFLAEALDEEEYARLDNVFRTAPKTIPVETIAQIVAYLVEEYTSRPTTASAQ